MNKQQSIEKIKALGPKDAVWCKTKAEAQTLCSLMHSSELKRASKMSFNAYSNRTKSCCYYIPKAGTINTKTDLKGIDITIHPASDFIGGEKEKRYDKLQEEISDGLDRIYGKESKPYCSFCSNRSILDQGPCLMCIPLNKDLRTDEEKQTNLHSTVNQMGETVTQEIHFICGSIRAIENIDTLQIEQSMFTTLVTDKLPRDINTENVAYIRIKAKGNNTRPGTVQPLIFHLKYDYKVTVRDIIPSTRKIGELIKYRCSNGDMVLIKRSNLNAIEG